MSLLIQDYTHTCTHIHTPSTHVCMSEKWQLLTFEVDFLAGQTGQDGETGEYLASVEGLVAVVELSQRLLYERNPQLFAVSLVMWGIV